MKMIEKARSIKGRIGTYITDDMSFEQRIRLRRVKRYVRRVVLTLVMITAWMLIFGESRTIEDAPIMWRINYEWMHLMTDIHYEIFARGGEGGHFWHRIGGRLATRG